MGGSGGGSGGGVGGSGGEWGEWGGVGGVGGSGGGSGGSGGEWGVEEGTTIRRPCRAIPLPIEKDDGSRITSAIKKCAN